ncbi:tetratricopeptide repeat protein [uncultured Alistipes sp.]|uniref:tetratricopeptide repeat protein n=1 Tax=uncultured Alistipes sp. TaxID=538949 RepID=UPI001F874E24|nr:tetratricopeptide repeat protein [uncultured Alistipes sp.]HIY13957.1 tetratricopeptide repeat protein [Candidatus Alistipes cottocaccae]
MKKIFVSAVALMAALTLSAQDVTTIFNEAGAAFNAKDFAGAAAKFEQVIDLGIDNDEVASQVATAKATLPKCYYYLGGAAIRSQNYDEALKQFSRSAELAELYGDMTQMSKSNGWVAKIYQIQGGDAFNNKDYVTAASVFEKGYKADPDNTGMALNLAMSYCEMGEYEKGMDIYEAIAAKTHPKYAEDVAQAKEMMALYTNNKVAGMQQAGDFDGIITMADAQLEKNPASALFQKVRLQAYSGKKDYAKVIELGQAAADAQTDEEDRSLMYYVLGAAYNAREMRDQAIAAFQKVTAGEAAENARAALAELQK